MPASSPNRLIFGRWLFSLGLALWLGGLLALGAVLAPVTAHFLQAHPALFADPLQKAGLLSAIVGGSLRVFNFVCYGSAVLMLVGHALLRPATSPVVARAVLALIVLLAASALFLGFAMFPMMDAAQAAGQMNTFDTLHHRYEAVSIYFQFPLLLVLLLMGSARDTPRSPLAA